MVKNNITTPIFRAIYNFMPNLMFPGDLEMLGEMVLIFCLALFYKDKLESPFYKRDRGVNLPRLECVCVLKRLTNGPDISTFT